MRARVRKRPSKGKTKKEKGKRKKVKVKVKRSGSFNLLDQHQVPAEAGDRGIQEVLLVR